MRTRGEMKLLSIFFFLNDCETVASHMIAVQMVSGAGHMIKHCISGRVATEISVVLRSVWLVTWYGVVVMSLATLT